MIDGEKIVLGGKEYVLADLNLKSVQKVYPYFSVLGNPSDPDFITAIIKVTTAGLQRNYPEITEDFVAENCMLNEMTDLGIAISNQLTKKKKSETLVPTTNPLTGANSTPELLQPQAGPGNI